MKKLLSFLFVLAIVTFAHAQDTTSLRMIGIGCNSSQDVLFFYPDTSDFMTVVSSINNPAGEMTGHSLFINPDDGLLYAVADPANDYGTTTRKIYRVNPLNGQFDLVMDLGDWTVEAAVTPDGRIFTIDGNGGAVPGAIYEIDIIAQTRTQVAASNVTPGMPRTMTYNPDDSLFYIYCADNGVPVDSLFLMHLDTWTETSMACAVDGEIHGAYYKDNQIWLSSYYGEIVYVDLSVGYDGVTVATSGYSVMDIQDVKFIAEPENFGICLNEPLEAVLHANYPSASYQWYRNDTLIPGEVFDTLFVNSYGDYRLLSEIDSSGNYIWSEVINVHSLNVPLVSLTAIDTLWCPGDSLLITGTPGGTSQWYMNGVLIPGATANSYYATEPGSYNMTKTNTNGCTDSAAVAMVIVEDNNCGGNVWEVITDASLTVYPVPCIGPINIVSDNVLMEMIQVSDLRGSVVYQVLVNDKNITLDLSVLSPGIYFLKVYTPDGMMVRQIMKE